MISLCLSFLRIGASIIAVPYKVARKMQSGDPKRTLNNAGHTVSTFVFGEIVIILSAHAQSLLVLTMREGRGYKDSVYR